MDAELHRDVLYAYIFVCEYSSYDFTTANTAMLVFREIQYFSQH